jgi:glutathione synthase/RimK-type ligase-like ATP-grasp enzyme
MAGAGNWPPRLAQEARLDELDRLVATAGEATARETIETFVERAALLNALGRPADARDAYLDVLKRAPDHFAALNDFSALLAATGFRSAARTVLAQAVAHHPDNPKGHVNLANLLLGGGDVAAARVHFEIALRLDPGHPQAHQGLGAVLAELGDRKGAARHRRHGFAKHFLTTLPYRGAAPPLPLLLLVSADGGDIPTASFLDDRIFASSVAVVDYFDPAAELPPHRLVFNAVGDADLCRPALEAAAALVARSAAPVINHPAAVLRTGRIANAARFGALPGVVTPRMTGLARTALAGPAGVAALASRGFEFPVLLRSPGFHTGRHFVLVETAAELGEATAALPGDELLVIGYLDARGAGGQARKYRVMIVDGRIYPLHLAVSRHWKVHYFTADMADHPGHRAEDAAFLDDMAKTIGAKAVAALERIAGVLGLDYAGIDFGLGRNGEVLLFEANATMVVNRPDPDERWSYRRPAVAAILDAVRAMMIGRAAPMVRGHHAR